LAATLVQFMHRHRLTRACIDDLCQLLRTLNIENVPKSFAAIKRMLIPDNVATKGKQYTICNECDKLSNEEKHCLNINCSQNKQYVIKPIDLLVLPITSQLRTIIISSNFSFIKHKRESNVLVDITDGDRYKQIQEQEHGRFLTFTLNVDGIQVAKSSNKSLWMFTLVLNELPRIERFKQQNLILAAVASCDHKPSRLQMQVMLQTLVYQLKHLENGLLVEFDDHHEEVFRIFLISCCCDKPAQSLVQNTNEPTGPYGCGRCCLLGKKFQIAACS
jgi:hypothetical protein